MLVLERKVQEGFWIEDTIFIKVLGIGRRRVKLGIEAPVRFKVMREELLSRALNEGGDGRDLAVPQQQPGDPSGTSAKLRRGRRRGRNDQRAA